MRFESPWWLLLVVVVGPMVVLAMRSRAPLDRRALFAVVALQVDLGFIEGPQAHPDLLLRPWLSDEMVVVAAPSHALARKRRVADGKLTTAASSSAAAAMAELAPQISAIAERVGALRR